MKPPPALSHRAGHAWEQLALPAIAKRRRAALLLCPANLAPVASRNAVVVIHDAAALREPSWYSGLYAAWQARILPAVARRAEHVVTVSEFSKAEIAELAGVPPERITVVPGGVSPAFRPDADARAAREVLGLHEPYVLTVASATARKNLRALVPLTAAMDVVVAGGGRPQFAAEQGLDGLRLLGHVDEALLPGLYAGAAAVVVPSLHEGFGLTALEAMASGTPVVASNRGALPETCGDAALVTEPTGEAMAHAVQAVLEDPGRWRAAGLERAKAFTWERTTAELDALLSAVAARRPSAGTPSGRGR